MHDLTQTEATALISLVSNLVWVRQPVGIGIAAAPHTHAMTGFRGVLFKRWVQGGCLADTIHIAVSYKIFDASAGDAYAIADWVCDRIRVKLC